MPSLLMEYGRYKNLDNRKGFFACTYKALIALGVICAVVIVAVLVFPLIYGALLPLLIVEIIIVVDALEQLDHRCDWIYFNYPMNELARIYTNIMNKYKWALSTFVSLNDFQQEFNTFVLTHNENAEIHFDAIEAYKCKLNTLEIKLAEKQKAELAKQESTVVLDSILSVIEMVEASG